MRLSDREREVLFDKLARHAGEGRLDVPELERRLAAVAAAQTHAEAAAVMQDLPPLAEQGAPAPRRVRWGRGHGEVEGPSPDWQPTPERFRDPRTGLIMRVWVAGDGTRHYVRDDAR